MQFTFLDMAGHTLFIRDDAERAEWTQEEMSLEMEFPFLDDKKIDIGQRVFFVDPSTGEHEIFEIKEARSVEPGHYQQVTAEHIIISELTDDHMDSYDIENETLSTAMNIVLSTSLWRVGQMYGNPTSSLNVNRGSVWQAVLDIRDAYNVYIMPHVYLHADGSIDRYINILPPEGTFRGIRLSVDKNFTDPSVIIDDSEVVTALFGYGGSETDDDGETYDITFKDVVWYPSPSHPGKPAGQKWIEDTRATALYGRNGRARFGFYQNSDITDPEILLQKTWEALSSSSTPDISIEGTVTDLYRLGYADQPLCLFDRVLVEVIPVGFKKEIDIIKMTTDLIDPTNTSVTIGSYIPNIVYYNKETETSSSGSSTGNNNKSDETTWQEFRTTIEFYADGTGMQIRAVQNDIRNQEEEIAIQEGRLEVTYNKITQEVIDRRNADAELSSRITVTARQITLETVERTNQYASMSGRITVNSNKIGLVVKETAGGYEVNAASIVLGINDQTGSYVKIKADTINLTGYVTISELNATNATISNLTSGATTANTLKAILLSASTGFDYQGHSCSFQTITLNGTTYHLLGY